MRLSIALVQGAKYTDGERVMRFHSKINATSGSYRAKYYFFDRKDNCIELSSAQVEKLIKL